MPLPVNQRIVVVEPRISQNCVHTGVQRSYEEVEIHELPGGELHVEGGDLGDGSAGGAVEQGKCSRWNGPEGNGVRRNVCGVNKIIGGTRVDKGFEFRNNGVDG